MSSESPRRRSGARDFQTEAAGRLMLLFPTRRNGWKEERGGWRRRIRGTQLEVVDGQKLYETLSQETFYLFFHTIAGVGSKGGQQGIVFTSGGI